MASNPHSPLTDAHLTQINNGLKQIQIAEAQVLLAKQAGIDVSDAEQKITDAKASLIRLKNVYFPGSM